MPTRLQQTTTFLQSKLPGFRPTVALITGSGLDGLAKLIPQPTVIPYAAIPHFPRPTVAGHAGQLLAGRAAGHSLLLFAGRFHCYEKRPPEQIVYPVSVAHQLGATIFIVTNAAGGINPRFRPGDLMMITDQINMLPLNPLCGMRDAEAASPFVDMTVAYSPRLRRALAAAARHARIRLRRGVYLATLGPSFETPAEVRAFARLGADAVGMSTVSEVIMARYYGMDVLGISCITNRAAGLTRQPLTHAQTLQVARATEEKLLRLLTEFLRRL